MAAASIVYVERQIRQAEDLLVVAELRAMRATGREREQALKEIADGKAELALLRAQIAGVAATRAYRESPEGMRNLVAEQVERLQALYG